MAWPALERDYTAELAQRAFDDGLYKRAKRKFEVLLKHDQKYGNLDSVPLFQSRIEECDREIALASLRQVEPNVAYGDALNQIILERDELQSRAGEVEHLQEQNQHLQNQLERASTGSQERIQQFQARTEQLQTQISSLTAEKDEMKKHLRNELMRVSSSSQERIQVLQSSTEQLRTQISLLKAEKDELNQHLQNQLMRASSDSQEQIQQLQQLQTQINSLTAEKEELEIQLQASSSVSDDQSQSQEWIAFTEEIPSIIDDKESDVLATEADDAFSAGHYMDARKIYELLLEHARKHDRIDSISLFESQIADCDLHIADGVRREAEARVAYKDLFNSANDLFTANTLKTFNPEEFGGRVLSIIFLQLLLNYNIFNGNDQTGMYLLDWHGIVGTGMVNQLFASFNPKSRHLLRQEFKKVSRDQKLILEFFVCILMYTATHYFDGIQDNLGVREYSNKVMYNIDAHELLANVGFLPIDEQNVHRVRARQLVRQGDVMDTAKIIFTEILPAESHGSERMFNDFFNSLADRIFYHLFGEYNNLLQGALRPAPDLSQEDVIAFLLYVCEQQFSLEQVDNLFSQPAYAVVSDVLTDMHRTSAHTLIQKANMRKHSERPHQIQGLKLSPFDAFNTNIYPTGWFDEVLELGGLLAKLEPTKGGDHTLTPPCIVVFSREYWKGHPNLFNFNDQHIPADVQELAVPIQSIQMIPKSPTNSGFHRIEFTLSMSSGHNHQISANDIEGNMRFLFPRQNDQLADTIKQIALDLPRAGELNLVHRNIELITGHIIAQFLPEMFRRCSSGFTQGGITILATSGRPLN